MGSPRPGDRTRGAQQKINSKKTKKAQKVETAGFGENSFEMVGTHKEQVMQLPRLPKYDVKKVKN